MDGTYAVEYEDVWFSFDNIQYLAGVNLQVKQGETFVLFGPTGSGKSFFLRLPLGLFTPQKGKIRVNGENITSYTHSQLYQFRTKIGFVSKNSGLISNLTARENVTLPLKYHTNLDEKVVNARVDQLLGFFDIFSYQNKRPILLNEAEKKRVAIARAFALDPEILFLDDPVTDMDPINLARILDSVFDFMKTSKLQQYDESSSTGGRTVIITATNPREYLSVADYFGLFYHGQISFIGTKDELFSSDNGYVRQYVQDLI